jgi:hypothetical protein
MIARLKAKKQVVIDSFKGTKATPHCEIITWTHGDNSIDRSAEGFAANGQYFYEKTTSVDDVEKVEKVIIHTFNRDLKAVEADALFPLLNIQYPENATYSERKRIEVEAGLRYIVAEEKYWGLKDEDWE